MAIKFVILLACASVALAGVLQPAYDSYYQQPTIIKQVQPAYVKQVVHEEPANYEFNYDVHDQHTGDIKQQQESAKNGVISGQYSLIDADGYRRIVDYTADDHHGFNANVRREPLEGHKVVKAVKVVQQPIIQKYIAQPQQQYYAAPQAQYYHH